MAWVGKRFLRRLNNFLFHVVSAGMAILLLFSLFTVMTPTADAAMRLQDRSLYMNSSQAGETTHYRVSFRYMSPEPVGSVELLFCQHPIPYFPCDEPSGLDVSGALLSDQTGEVGFTISDRSANRLVLSRTATVPADQKSTYTFENIINPASIDEAFAIRLRTFSSTDGTGPQIDFGSIRGQATEGIEISTQVPPMLIFCFAEEVEYNCMDTNNTHYVDLGSLDNQDTLVAQSQMAVGTNASGGFAITAVGTPMSAGTKIIDSLDQPSISQQGENQFGINLVANTNPQIGQLPEGSWTNAVVADDYAMTNQFKFTSGDVVAYSPNVSLMKKFTVSYMVNSSKELKAGVYTTTINFIASGRF